DRSPIRRDVRITLHGRGTRQPTVFASLPVHDPEVASIGESNVRGADGRLAQEAGGRRGGGVYNLSRTDLSERIVRNREHREHRKDQRATSRDSNSPMALRQEEYHQSPGKRAGHEVQD